MSKALGGSEIRQLFLDYFTSQDHMIEPGVSLIPKNDPTLLWINAGVAGLKKYFDGSQKPEKNRITNVQKSIRTNDIENVGKTARHHTFFEMLGNFSIGDYFKKEAIHFGWEFLTGKDWLGIDPERLYVSVYTDDDQAYQIWTEEIGVDPSRILKTDDNFWEIGKGPGGPDSEIFFDRGEKYDPDHLGEKLFFDEMENDRYVEVWNIVFSQYDCNPEIDRKDYPELPQKNIDTGMGLERLTALLQDAETNFDTDLFRPTLRHIEQMAKEPYEGENKMAYRVIADHIRTLVFALSDGADFSNSGRGYVLRRLLRRASRYGLKLGIEKPFLSSLVDDVIEAMGDFYTDLAKNEAKIKEKINKEEIAFKKTLDTGQELLAKEIEALKNEDKQILSGEVAFKLYDTYGFPVELTQEIVQEQGLDVDLSGFEKEMELQKERARNARVVEDSFESQNEDLMNFTRESEFIGYDNLKEEGEIIALFKEGHLVDSLQGAGQMIVDPTIFYALSGGQVADHGMVENDHGKARVLDVNKARNGQHLLSVDVFEGELKIGERVSQILDIERRKATTANHSATHLLQSALRSVLGEEVAQAGSYVGPDYLRFDFTYSGKPSKEQLEEVEKKINEMIYAAHPVTKVIMPIEEAEKLGATHLFDEKYGDEVRVVTMGDVSMEFCAGCHVDNTREIGLCHIVSEESIGSNTRRITAKTGLQAYEDFIEQQHLLDFISQASRAKNLKTMPEKIANDYKSLHQLQKENEQLRNRLAQQQAGSWIQEAKEIEGIQYLYKNVENENPKSLKEQILKLIKAHPDLLLVVANSSDKGLSILMGAGQAVQKKGLEANVLLKELLSKADGKGGGKKDVAQGAVGDEKLWKQAVLEFARQLPLRLQ